MPTPTERPTATPYPAPTVPELIKDASISASLAPSQIGNLAFIKDGNIYHSDFKTFSLLTKNEIPAGDKLAWSQSGNFLSWRNPERTATPSALTIYDRQKGERKVIKASDKNDAELVDYKWSPTNDSLLLLVHDSAYKILTADNIASGGASLQEVVSKTSAIRQIFWPEKDTLLYLGSEGIVSLNLSTKASLQLVASNNISYMNLSGDSKKILYVIGDGKSYNLYSINLDGTNNQNIPVKPQNIDMGTTNLTADILDKGFIPYALFFPKNDNKLLVGYKYLENLPLVGVYDLSKSSFKAITPFTLKKDDFLIDDLTLVGTRIKTGLKETPSWQLTFYTLEEDSKLGLIRVIPGASSPAFYFSK